MATPMTTRPAKLTVSLALAIDHTVYTVEPLTSDDPTITRAWRLTKKSDGAVYDVAQTPYGPTCDCTSQTFSHEGLDGVGCKHLQAMRLMGLLDPPPAVKTPAVVRCAGCDRPSVREADSMPWCQACFDRMTPAPVACCSPGEAEACKPCQASTPAADVGTELLDRGLALAAAEVNLPVALPDHFEDEAPVLDDYEEWQFPAALPAEPEPYDPSEQDEADFLAWKREGATRDHLHDPTLTLAELVEKQVEFYERWDNAAGRLLAATMGELLMKIKLTSASTPEELEARVESLEQDVREAWESAGYEAGRQAGCHCGEVVLA